MHFKPDLNSLSNHMIAAFCRLERQEENYMLGGHVLGMACKSKARERKIMSADQHMKSFITVFQVGRDL